MPRSVNIDRPQPTWKTGFARSADESVAPELWKGLEFGIFPELGPTGVNARDVIGDLVGTLTNITLADGWVVDDGAYCIKTGGTTEHVKFITPPLSFPGPFTFVQWFNPDAWEFFQGFNWGVSGADHLRITSGTSATDLKMIFDVGFSGVQSIEVASTVVVGKWQMVAVTRDSSDVLRLSHNAKVLTGSITRGGTFSPGITNPNDMTIPSDANAQSGKYGQLLWYERNLSASQLSQLYTIGRGGILQRKPLVIGKAPAAVGFIPIRRKRIRYEILHNRT